MTPPGPPERPGTTTHADCTPLRRDSLARPSNGPRLQEGCSSSWPTPRLGRLNVDSYQGVAQRSLPTVAEYGARGVRAELAGLVKQADLDKGRRNDELTSEELRPPRRKVRCPLPCVASAATSHASALPPTPEYVLPSSTAMPVDATQCSAWRSEGRADSAPSRVSAWSPRSPEPGPDHSWTSPAPRPTAVTFGSRPRRPALTRLVAVDSGWPETCPGHLRGLVGTWAAG